MKSLRVNNDWRNAFSRNCRLIAIRSAKVAFSLKHPMAWRGLLRGVAPSVEHWEVLRNVECDLILDVGANRGQFALLTRILFPDVTLRAYEPLTTEINTLRKVVGVYRGVEVYAFALGEKDERRTMNISNRKDSSSLLPIGELQSRIFPRTESVAKEEVELRRLDDLKDHWMNSSNALLKLDVQGYELAVLRGAKDALRHCKYVYVECSEVSLYEGQPVRCEIVSFLENEGFALQRSVNECFYRGALVQADYLFNKR